MSTEDRNSPLTPDMVRAMAEELATRAPEDILPAQRKAALWSRIVQLVETLPPPGTITFRTQEGTWLPALPGVDVKILYLDPINKTQTALWRMQPGSKLPAHPHRVAEECLVLEGAIRLQNFVINQGDFHVALAGQHHSEIFSDNGALLLVRAEMADHYSPEMSY